MEIIKDLGTRVVGSRKRRFVMCRCSCGKEVELRSDRAGSAKSCGCWRNELRDIIPVGEAFGRLTIVKDLGIRGKNDYKERFILAKCECESEVEIAWSSVKRGRTESCGCLQKEVASEIMVLVGKSNLTHGMEGTHIYRAWDSMKQRCYNPNAHGYKYYGGKGVEVCKEWKHDFSTFYDWAMVNGYEEGLTVDRIESSGDYEPTNCQWLSKSDNSIKMHEDKKREMN